jgi:hypothetical protein
LKASCVDDGPDFGTARAAIRAGMKRRPDRLDTGAAASRRFHDLMRADCAMRDAQLTDVNLIGPLVAGIRDLPPEDLVE